VSHRSGIGLQSNGESSLDVQVVLHSESSFNITVTSVIVLEGNDVEALPGGLSLIDGDGRRSVTNGASTGASVGDSDVAETDLFVAVGGSGKEGIHGTVGI
jgi:hypothetical protein